MDSRILFNLEFDASELSELTEGRLVLEYESELVLESSTDFFVKIFHIPQDKSISKIFGRTSVHNILSKFKVVKILSPRHLIHVDFCDYSYKGISFNASYKEGEMEYLIIRLQGVKLVYSAPEQHESLVYLNDISFRLIEMNYQYQYRSSHEHESYRFEPYNTIKKFVQFNDVKFIPEHNFFARDKVSGLQVTIAKEPRFRMVHSCATEGEVKRHIEALCNLYSFFSNKKIDWRISKIFAEGKLFVEMREVVERDIGDLVFGMFTTDFYNSPLSLITSVDAPHVVQNDGLVSKLIESFNYALRAGDETKFMILYSILEQLRNYYILSKEIKSAGTDNYMKPDKVRDEYKFKLGKNKTNKFIENVLHQILDIVDLEDMVIFKRDIPLKAKNLRFISMADQFGSYFQFVKIDPQKYNLDFDELRALRNEIFHGRPLKDLTALKKINWHAHLPRMTGELMLKFFGIDDLKAVRRYKELPN